MILPSFVLNTWETPEIICKIYVNVFRKKTVIKKIQK